MIDQSTTLCPREQTRSTQSIDQKCLEIWSGCSPVLENRTYFWLPWLLSLSWASLFFQHRLFWRPTVKCEDLMVRSVTGSRDILIRWCVNEQHAFTNFNNHSFQPAMSTAWCLDHLSPQALSTCAYLTRIIEQRKQGPSSVRAHG